MTSHGPAHDGTPVQLALPAATGHTQAGSGTVLIPFHTGHRPSFPTGQRLPLPLLPAHLRPLAPATATTPPRVGNWRRLLAASGALVLLILGFAAFTVLRTSSPGPSEVVQQFFTALTNRDYDQLPIILCRDDPLCQPDALRTGYQPPQHVTVGNATGNDNNRSVPVTYTLDRQTITTTIAVYSIRAGSFGGRSWGITEPPGTHLTAPGHTPAPVTIAAARVFGTRNGQDTTFWAPPGTYTLTRAATLLLQPAQTTLTVTSQPAVTITLPTTINPPITTQIQQLIHDRIDQCASQRAFAPTVTTTASAWHSCPFEYEDNRHSITDDPTWTINNYPQLRLDPADDGTITITTSVPGQAHISYQWTLGVVEPRTWTDVTDTVQITITGRISDTTGTLDWQPA